MTTTMTLEEALGLPAGPELDAVVAEKVMGWCIEPPSLPVREFIDPLGSTILLVQSDGKKRQPLDWSPSTEIAAAWEVVEKVCQLRTLKVEIEKPFDKSLWSVWLHADDGDIAGSSLDAEMPLAICRAALKACWKD